MFNDIYSGKRVLVTGHTGFKGSWLCAWLNMLGAEVCGLSLAMDTEFVHHELLKTPMLSQLCDTRDKEKTAQIIQDFQPDAVFHLAAQPIVRYSYDHPVETFAANVMGTVNVLEACRHTESVKAVVAISSDKCYENREQLTGYKEDDAMGGYDPYSASKGCTELVISSYRRSFFNCGDYNVKHSTLLASGRAGNVVGGGDWAQDRLVPDIMRAAAKGTAAIIRNPRSCRPWQHVLEPLSGYLLLGERLLKGDVSAAQGWNFGPKDDGVVDVEQASELLRREWSAVNIKIDPPKDQPHEAGMLRLDCSKAEKFLGWHGVLSLQETFEMTAAWYREFYISKSVITAKQIDGYINKAVMRGLSWTK